MSLPTDRTGASPGSVMARLARPVSETQTRLAVVADPHVSTRRSGTSKLFDRTELHLRNAVRDIRDRNVDAAVSVGDLTKDGEPWNYDAVDDILAELDVPFYAVPGNHDVPKEGDEVESLPISGFVERYTPGSLPFATRVGGVDLVGLNSAGTESRLFDSHDGEVSDRQLAWLDETLPDLDNPVVVVHHNLPSMSAQVAHHRDTVEPEMAIPPEMRNADALVERLAGNGVPLVLTGHLHLPSTAREGDVRELMVPTTCSFPQAYLLLDIDERGTTVRMVPAADTDGLALGHSLRAADSATARELTTMAAARVADFPLVDE